MDACAYCKTHPSIENSHIVPAYIVRHLKANSPGFILDSWVHEKKQDGLKGPYLCMECDNVLFSGWENHFKSTVFDAIQGGQPAQWDEQNSIRFILSVAFRFTVHFLESSPHEANKRINLDFRDLFKQALIDLSVLDSRLYIYPYQCRPILTGCGFVPGLNHFLQLGLQCQPLPAEGSLPQALAMFLPGMIILFTDGDVGTARDPDFLNPTSLALGKNVDYGNVNLTMPQFLKPILNQAVGHTTGHQKSMGMWNSIQYKADKLANPNRQLYKSQAWNSQLKTWQLANCQQGH
jgi:hypothetical protein